MKKDWIAREMTVEVVVGVFLAMIILGLFYFTIFLSGQKWKEAKFPLEVTFSDVMGLREGDDVVVRGMPLGAVKSLSLEENGVKVGCLLSKKLSIKKDYKIIIVSKSMLGGRYLQISEGSDEFPELPAGVALNGDQPYDLMTDAAELVGVIKEGFAEGGIIDNLKSTSVKIEEIASRLESGKGTLGKLLSEDETLYKNLSESADSLNSIASRLERGEGTIGKLLSEDDSLYKETEEIVKEVRALLDDMRETSPVVTFTSVFFGAL